MVDQVAERVKFDKEEDIKPFVLTFRKIFEPMTKAMKDIALIPKEVSRIVDVIRKDIKSGQPDRFVSGSKKSADSVDMIQMMKDFNERNSEEGKKRQQDLADLERIAQERQKAEADIQKLRELGTPAEIGEDNKVKILNEKEIIDRQKEYIKEQKEVTKIEKQIADEKGKGDDADADRLVMLKDSLDTQNELLQKQGEVLGDRLPRQKVSEAVTKRDFIPGPLMEAYDNIAESATQSAQAIGGIFQPLIGLKKVFTKKEEYEDEYLKEQQDKNKKQGLAVVLTTLKFALLAVTLGTFIKGIYDLGKMLGFFEESIPADKQQKGETLQNFRDRVDAMPNKTEVEKQNLKTESMDFVTKFIYTSGIGNESKDLAAAAQKDENIRAKRMRENYNKDHAKFLNDNAKLESEKNKDKNGDNTAQINNIVDSKVVAMDNPIKPMSKQDVIG